MLSRRDFMLVAASTAALPALPAHAAGPQILRIGMTASDLPTTHGIPNNGGEGFRFLGHPAHDALVNWDFLKVDAVADVTPGLFTEWKPDEVDQTKWYFTVRQGVKFHDGTDLTADAIIWNLRASTTINPPNTMRQPRQSCAPAFP